MLSGGRLSEGYLDTNIKTGGTNTSFRISICDKRDDFTFRIVNFPHMDSNIPANPAYGVYVSQLLRYARICITYLFLRLVFQLYLGTCAHAILFCARALLLI